MAKARLLAFLLCDNATRDRDGKVTLHGIFDRIIAPRSPREEKLFFIYYRVLVDEPCTITLRVVDPRGHEVPGNWRDSLTEIGPMQTVWALTSSLLKQPGPYFLELVQENGKSKPLSLAQMRLSVEESKGWVAMSTQFITLDSASCVNFVDPQTARLTPSPAPPDRRGLVDGDFFQGKSIEKLAREQGVGPIRDISVFARGLPHDADVDELLAQLEELRGL